MNVLDLIAKLSLDSSAYEQGLDKAKSIAGTVGSGIKSAMGVGVKAIGMASTAMTAFAGTSVKTGMDFDKSMSQVAATMGKTMEEMETEVGSTTLTINGEVKEFTGTLRDFAQEMGRNTAFSATQAADALNYMALAGYDAQTSMDMLPNVLNLAAAGNFDLARASDMVTDTQTAFGISLERTSQMVDEMAKAASTGNTSVEQLGDAFLTVGGLAQELNGGFVTLADGTKKPVDGIQELEIAMTAMANAGVKGTEAGTHMRNMLLKLSSPTDAGTIALEEMGVAVFDTEGNMRSLADVFGDLSNELDNMTQEQKIQTISDLFNTRDLASAEALLNAVGQDWNKIGASILDAEGAASQMADTQLDNLAGDITLFKSALEGAQIAISDGLTPSFREFVQFGTQGLSDITGAFQAGGIAGAMDAFGTILSDGLNLIISKVPEFIDAGMQLLGSLGRGIIDNIPTIVDAMVEVGIQLAEGLTTAIPALLTGANRLVMSLINSFSENKEKLMAVGTQLLQTIADGLVTSSDIIIVQIENLIESIASFLSEHATEIFTAVSTLIQELAYTIPQSLPIIIEQLAVIISDLALALSNPDVLTPLVDGALAIIEAIAMGLISALPVLIETAPKILQNIVTGIVNNLPKIVDAGIQLIGMLVQSIIENLPLILASAIQIVTALASGLIEALPTLLTASWKLTTELWTSILEALPKFLENGVKIVAAIIKGIASMLGSIARAAIELVTQIINTITDRGKRLLELGKSIINFLGNGIKGKLNDAKNWGKDLINNFIGGIKEKWEALKDAIANVGQSIKDLLGFSEPKEGPLSNFHTYAPDMMDLFAKGVRDNEDMLKGVVADAFDFGDVIAKADVPTPVPTSSGGGEGFTQVVNVYSPDPLTPSEVGRHTRIATQDMVLALRGKK